jgi:hypothetical protein
MNIGIHGEVFLARTQHGDGSCNTGEIPLLIQQYPFICVSGSFFDELRPVQSPVEFFGQGEVWQTALGSGTWTIGCKNNMWALWWIVANTQQTGEVYATSGTFPNISFSDGYSSTGGMCP